jgi:hypothetical protein
MNVPAVPAFALAPASVVTCTIENVVVAGFPFDASAVGASTTFPASFPQLATTAKIPSQIVLSAMAADYRLERWATSASRGDSAHALDTPR